MTPYFRPYLVDGVVGMVFALAAWLAVWRWVRNRS